MHIEDMTPSQRQLVCHMAAYCAAGAVLTALHSVIWLLGIVGYVLIATSAGRLRETQPGFDQVQLYAGLCAACKLVCMALSGIDLITWLGSMLLPVLMVLLIYALWHAYGRMCADGNRVGRAALVAQMLCAALAIASNVLNLGIFGGMLAIVYTMAQWMSFGFEVLAAVLTAAFILIKRHNRKEEKQ